MRNLGRARSKLVAILPPCFLASSDKGFLGVHYTLKAEKDADAMRRGG